MLRQCLLLLDVEGQRVSHLHTNFPRDATVESVHRNSAEGVHGLHYDILAFCRFQFLLQSGTEYRPKSIEIGRTRLLHTIVLQFVHLSHNPTSTTTFDLDFESTNSSVTDYGVCDWRLRDPVQSHTIPAIVHGTGCELMILSHSIPHPFLISLMFLFDTPCTRSMY